MALLTKAQLQEHVETDLEDDAIDRLLDDAEVEIIRLFGAHITQTDYLEGGGKYIFPSRVILSGLTVVETVGTTDTTLAADDYSTLYNGRGLLRLGDGTNGRTYWGDRIKLTYTPEDDTDQRKRVQADLVRLAIQYDGLKAEKAGNWSATHVEYELERDKILGRLSPGHRLI